MGFIGGGLAWKGAATLVPDLSVGDWAVPDGQYQGAVVSKDVDLVAGNIRNGVSLFGVTGNMSLSLDAQNQNTVVGGDVNTTTLSCTTSASASTSTNVLHAVGAMASGYSNPLYLDIDGVNYASDGTGSDLCTSTGYGSLFYAVQYYLLNVAAGAHTVKARHPNKYCVGLSAFIHITKLA